ncbi:MAG: hypothetical protein MJY79_09120 [Bacteroidaceae bacterium]|nr:hypothetical protein [Bacteroidaceae bacterium]
MNSFKKYLGAMIVIIGAIILICSFFCGWNNYNGVQLGAMGVMILGLIVYIMMNKRVS